MTRLLTTVCALALVAACQPATEAPPPADTPASTAPDVTLLLPLPDATVSAIAEADLHARIAAIASDTFEGRGPGSATGEASADWIAAELARVGVKPGPQGWFQTVNMVEQTVDEALSSLSITTPAGTRPLALRTDAVYWTKHQDKPSVSFTDSDVVFVGYGVVAPEYGWNDYEGLDVRGKTVVMFVNDPGYGTGNPELFKGRSMTYYGRWTYKFEEAARQGATAALVIHETGAASYGWDVVASSWGGAQADLVRANGGADRAIMEGWITQDTAKAMFAEAGLDFAALSEAAKVPGFRAVPLPGVKASGAITQTVSRRESRNVVGMIPGTTTPDEYVLLTAHWDHLGKKDTFLEDDIFNGAVDNATGVSAVLEMAEALAAKPQQRSILFAFVTLEESGLLGSAYMAENPVVDLAQIVAGVNIDGMLPVGRTRDMVVVGYGASELEDMLKDALVPQGRTIKADPVPEAGYFYRSDHISFAKTGVPMLYADGGDDLIEGGIPAGRALAETYTQINYHKVGDEYKPDWNLSGMVEDIGALLTVVERVANSTDWPNWYEGNEFRATRDAQRAGRGD